MDTTFQYYFSSPPFCVHYFILAPLQKENRAVGGEKKLFHFIFDEAHKYISEKDDENIKSIKIFEQIAKEGRKFGVFMILASQRPGETSKTVLSQCNNFILHKIRNNVDLEQMRKSIPYLNDSQLTRISYLRTGSALLVGEPFSIPMEIIIDGKDYGDISKSYLPSEIWRE
ncbi:DNA helicase HerA-like ATPase [Paenibacillus sp. DS2015]|uniref:ATP-binding protein n=1 Tax=Paenibacillus sp. DS2015 TaxID=3373917 RepID=UPI003D1A5CCD